MVSRPRDFGFGSDLRPPHPLKLFSFVQGLGGAVLKPAISQTLGEEEWLEATAGETMLTGADLALLVEGQAGDRARMRLTPNVGEPDGVVTLDWSPQLS